MPNNIPTIIIAQIFDFLLFPLNELSKKPLNKTSSHIAGIKATTTKLAIN